MARNSLGGIAEIVMSQSAQAGTPVTAQVTVQYRASEGRPSGGGPGRRQGEFREPGLSGGGGYGMRVSSYAGGPSGRGGRAAR